MSQYPPPGQYSWPQQAYWQESPRSKGLAITALVLGIIAILSCWTLVGGVLFGIFAVIFGLIALAKSRSGTGAGGVMAGFGLFFGLAGIVVGVVLGLFFWNIFKDVGGRDYIDCLSNAGSDQIKIRQCEDELNKKVDDRFRVTVTSTPAR